MKKPECFLCQHKYILNGYQPKDLIVFSSKGNVVLCIDCVKELLRRNERSSDGITKVLQTMKAERERQ